jgi:hypothetical protein
MPEIFGEHTQVTITTSYLCSKYHLEADQYQLSKNHTATNQVNHDTNRFLTMTFNVNMI